MSSPQNGEENSDELTTQEKDRTDGIVDSKEREDGDLTEEKDNENGGWRKIPVTLATIKEEEKVPTQGETKKNRRAQETSQPPTTKTKNETEKEVDIVEVPKFPDSTQKQEASSSGKPRYRSNSSCGYKEDRSPCCRYGNQGPGCCPFSPLALPSFGYPVMFMPVCPPMGLYGPCMTNLLAGMSCRFQGKGHHCCIHQENPSKCCPYDNQNDSFNHMNGCHNNCNNERQHCNRDDLDQSTYYKGHSHCQSKGGYDDQGIRQDDTKNSFNTNGRQDCTDEDDNRSVEELLEDYLEDIDEKTERIHEILNEYEAMDLFVSVLGFQPEEVHVTARGRTVTVKGDHQYSEATWVRVRNFSECYEIPEEFDVSRTTAMITGDTLCVRVPHVNGQ